MPIYSRDELVEELTSFYKLLIKLYLPDSSLNIPPEDGWPEITAERYAFLKKNDTVINLMKHLPYIHQDGSCGSMNTIYPMTTCVQYNGPFLQKLMRYEYPNKEAVDPLEEVTVIPAHVLTIAMETSGGDGFFWFVDTERGTITLMGEGTERTHWSIECEEGSTENWQEHATYIVKDFFNMMRDKFESLNFLPISPTEVRFTAQDIDNWNEKLRNIFREHGWPSESYKKEKCLEKVQKVDEEIRDGYVQAYRARVAAKQEEKKRQAGNGEVEKEEGDNDH